MVALFTVVKGLPLAYNRDLQEDKALVFEAVDVVSASLDAIAQLVQGLTIRPERIAADMGPELLATDRAEQLVRQGVPFREAHRMVAAQFRHLPDGPASPEDIAHSLSARDRTMGPGPTNLQKQIAKARQLLTS
jgi:argininosuccinate lyase